jgi:plastocyanin
MKAICDGGRGISFANSDRGSWPDMNVRVALLLCAAVSLSACGGDSGGPVTSPTPTPPASGTATITIPIGASNLTNTAFSPNPLTASVGTTVTFVNNDTTLHDATAVAGSFATGSIAPGRSATVTLRTAGRVDYLCTIHPGMTGTITVQ